ncbi:sodium/glucose cotransporter 1-like isoform X2 [Peromyscus eremicus]|uniref:sodium/glucose cotransporter 1-like isoform X2 n=1 Tax=Peromyscus eremicus TaxID=42410 RepID=UPI0027DBD438|nr:sodium/glucose cotransporter 1-like isoform X2 [Peromyscus eremicus]
MASLKSEHGFTRDPSTVDLSIHSTMDTLVMTSYFLLVLFFGMWAVLSQRRGTVEDFFLAGQNLPWWLMGISIYSSNTGSGHYMGLAGMGAASGIAVGALEWNTIFMLFVLGWIFVPMYSKAEVVTLPEYLRKRFGSLRIQFFSVCFFILYIFSRISMEISFGAMYLKMVWNTDIYQTVLLVVTITGLYTITGGLATVAYVETLQAGIMLLGSALLVAYAIQEVGGYQGLLNKYFQAIPNVTQQGNWTARPQCYMPRQDAFHIFRSCVSGDIPWLALILGATTVSLFYGCADQISVQRFLAGRSKLHMKGGCLLYGYLKLLPMFLMVMPGMISRILFPGLKGFMMSTVCASIMSSLTSIFNSSSALFTLNIYTRIRPTATEKEIMVAGRFFVIILLAVTIVWIPTMEMASSEALFEYMLVFKSCLTPSVTAVFLLAVFCKRVNEQGAFWGLTLGTTIGVFRLLAEFFYGPSTCEGGRKCPKFICGLHYLYFGFLLFLITILIILAISLATKPIKDEHLHGLCWSLRNSRQRRLSLNKEMKWKVFPSSTSQQGMFGEASTCFWKLWDLFCGLDTQSGSEIGPGNSTEEKIKALWEQMESSDTSAGLAALARRMAARKEEEHRERMKDWSDVSESPFWKRVVNVSGTLLFVLLIAAHIFYA